MSHGIPGRKKSLERILLYFTISYICPLGWEGGNGVGKYFPAFPPHTPVFLRRLTCECTMTDLCLESPERGGGACLCGLLSAWAWTPLQVWLPWPQSLPLPTSTFPKAAVCGNRSVDEYSQLIFFPFHRFLLKPEVFFFFFLVKISIKNKKKYNPKRYVWNSTFLTGIPLPLFREGKRKMWPPWWPSSFYITLICLPPSPIKHAEKPGVG